MGLNEFVRAIDGLSGAPVERAAPLCAWYHCLITRYTDTSPHLGPQVLCAAGTSETAVTGTSSTPSLRPPPHEANAMLRADKLSP